MTRTLPRYEITLATKDKKSGEPDPITVPAGTRVRKAISRANYLLRATFRNDARPRPQITVRGWQPGDTSKRGRVEYQAHIDRDGKIHVEER
jgi:hypothetical protein